MGPMIAVLMSNIHCLTTDKKEPVSGLIAKYDPPLLDVGIHEKHSGYFER